MQPLLLSCGPCRHNAAPAAIMRPTAAIMRPLSLSGFYGWTAGPLLPFCSLGPSFPAWSAEAESEGAHVAAGNLPGLGGKSARGLPIYCKPVPLLYIESCLTLEYS
jgi:hypothetical protein